MQKSCLFSNFNSANSGCRDFSANQTRKIGCTFTDAGAPILANPAQGLRCVSDGFWCWKIPQQKPAKLPRRASPDFCAPARPFVRSGANRNAPGLLLLLVTKEGINKNITNHTKSPKGKTVLSTTPKRWSKPHPYGDFWDVGKRHFLQ